MEKAISGNNSKEMTQQSFTYSKSMIETVENGVKYAPSLQKRHQDDDNDVVLVSLLLTMKIFQNVL